MLGTVLLPVPVLGQNAEPDLDAINDEIRDRQSRRLGLEEEAETIQNQSKRLRLRVIELARDIRNIDIERERIEERLSELAVTESQLDAQLQRDRAALSRTLAGLQALETQPPPAFAVHPDDALAAVQGAIALASIVPSMQSRAQALRSQLVELVAIRAHMDRQSGVLVRAEQDAAAAQRSIEVALAEKAAAEADIRAPPRARPKQSPSWCGRPKTSKTLPRACKSAAAATPHPRPPKGAILPAPAASYHCPSSGRLNNASGRPTQMGRPYRGLPLPPAPAPKLPRLMTGAFYTAARSGNMAALSFSALTAITR